MNILKNTYPRILLVLTVFLIGFFVRFYQLGNIPQGLYPDESAIGYNAYSVLLTGKDEYGQHLPLYFRSFDDYKFPVYIYATALSIKAFGVNNYAVRFPSALFGWFTVVAMYFLLYKLSKSWKLAALSSFFLAINPWHVFFSRTGYEVNFATALLVFGTLFFISAVQKGNKYVYFFFSIISFVLAVYTYNVTRLVAPLIFFSLIVSYYKQITVSSKKLLLSLLVLFAAGMIPFVVTFIPMQSQPGFAAHDDALITGKVAKADILQTRSYFITLPSIMQKTLFNYWTLLAWKFVGNVITFFSTGFFFLVGADHPHENIGGFGMFYYFDFPLIVYGAYQGLKRKTAFLYPFYWWFLSMLLVGGIIVAIPKDNAFGTRTYSVVIPLIIFSAFGMYKLLQNLMHMKQKIVKNIAMLLVGIFVAYSSIFYFTSYFVRFPIEYAKEWRSEDPKTIAYIRSIENNYNKVVFDDSAQFLYTSLLFYGKYPPHAHQTQAVYQLNGLVNTVVRDGKYEFRKADFGKEMATPGTLFITASTHVPEDKQPLAVFSYPTRPVVIFYDRKIAQFPTTDVAYEIFESGTSHK